MARRQHVTIMFALAVVAFFTLTYFMSSGASRDGSAQAEEFKVDLAGVPSNILTGGAIAPKLGNETAKAELGRAAWKVLHTMMARFPEKPSPDDSLALKTYIQLFARLYPCGECAAHFQKLLSKYPPQTSGRNAAAGWACFVHNEVNTRLKKEQFDCAKIGDFYDCGCGDEDKKKSGGVAEDLKQRDSVTVERDGLTRGG